MPRSRGLLASDAARARTSRRSPQSRYTRYPPSSALRCTHPDDASVTAKLESATTDELFDFIDNELGGA